MSQHIMMLCAFGVECQLELVGHDHMMHHVPAAFAQRMPFKTACTSAR